MDEQEAGVGSIADFIDSTIVRCLMDYDRSVGQNHHVTEGGTLWIPGHMTQTERAQERGVVLPSWALGHQSQNPNGAMEDGLFQEAGGEAVRHCSQPVDLRNQTPLCSDSRAPSSPSASGPAERKSGDDVQLSLHHDPHAVGPESSSSSPADGEPQDLTVPGSSALGKDSNLRHLHGAVFEAACHMQPASELEDTVAPVLLNSMSVDGCYTGGKDLYCRQALSELASVSVVAHLKKGIGCTPASPVSAVAMPVNRAETDCIGKNVCPSSLSAGLELECKGLRPQSSSSETAAKNSGSPSSRDANNCCSEHAVTDSSAKEYHNADADAADSDSPYISHGNTVPQEVPSWLDVGSGSRSKAKQCVDAATSCAGWICERGEGSGETSTLEVTGAAGKDGMCVQRVHSEHKATDKVKKRLQKRYFETEPEKETTAVETFNYDGGKPSEWRIKKWKKRRFQPAEDGDTKGSKSKLHKSKRKKNETESQLNDLGEPGFIEYGSDEEVDDRLSQTEIADAVDVTSATKYFELNLTDFGPYSINYSRNGRHLLLGGERGHIAAFEWQTKRLSFEMNTEATRSIRWLHQETMLAAAHPSGVCFYDNTGLELHALTDLDAVLRLEFLPHHMLLASSNEKGFLGYTDVSMGTRVAGICTGFGRLDVMTQNPANAIIHLGHASGTVTLWSPNVKGPLVKVLTHKAPVRAVAIDSTGNYMATSGVDKRLKVFDLRTYKLLNKTHIPVGASSLSFSQRGLLAAGLGNRVQVYKDSKSGVVTPYLSHVMGGSVHSVQFCPFEDVLGSGHQRGFSSLIVPGSGDANYDALSINPMANRKQRQHTEVRLLLDKLQPEMIGLTNWVWELANKAGGQKAPQPSTKKLGQKQKEEMHRERVRQSQKDEKKKQKTEKPADSNPLARFKKSKS
ncbi:uncharacterized protein LOC143289913 isoform X2 [Babylonia areolata]